jgi:hypothetical protein
LGVKNLIDGVLSLYFFRTSIEAPTIIEMFPAYYIFNFLLLLLLVLHVGWTYLILRIVYNSIIAGQVIYQTLKSILEFCLVYLLEDILIVALIERDSASV